MIRNAFFVTITRLRAGRLAIAVALGLALFSPGSPVVAQSRAAGRRSSSSTPSCGTASRPAGAMKPGA